MNKSDLVERLSIKHNMTKAKSEAIIDDITGTIKKQLKRGDYVKLIGFGTFRKNKRQARNGHNPRTGEKLEIPSKWYPKFIPGAEFKEAVKS